MGGPGPDILYNYCDRPSIYLAAKPSTSRYDSSWLPSLPGFTRQLSGAVLGLIGLIVVGTLILRLSVAVSCCFWSIFASCRTWRNCWQFVVAAAATGVLRDLDRELTPRLVLS